MLHNNFARNQVLSFNKIVVPEDYLKQNPSATASDIAAKCAKDKGTFIGRLAENKADAWNVTNAHAIDLIVKHGDGDTWMVIGEWAACLTVDDCTKELDCRHTANQLAAAAEPLVEKALKDLDVDYDYIEQGIYLATNRIKDVIFDIDAFDLLRNTSFFKHINKAFDQEKLKEIFDEINPCNNLPFHPTYDEQQQAFKAALRQTFECFLVEDNKYIINALTNFELEQVAFASAKACDIVEAHL